jgi:hypothetical protein
MELLQAFSYIVIDQCSEPLNRFLTLIGYLHIAFQPFFVNMLSLYFVPSAIRFRVTPFANICCFIGAIAMAAKLFQYPALGTCDLKVEPLCSTLFCSTSGNWHIAWNLPLNGMPMTITVYLLVCALLPMLYGSWKIVSWH